MTKDEDDILGEAYIKFVKNIILTSRIVKENRFKFRTEVNSTNSIRTTVTKMKEDLGQRQEEVLIR